MLTQHRFSSDVHAGSLKPAGRNPQQIREFPLRTILLALSAATLTVPMMPAPALAHDNSYHGQTWRDSQGRLRCKRSNGTTGLIVGAAGGALVGRAIDTRGERATGTILGAAAGALIGREVQRSRSRCR